MYTNKANVLELLSLLKKHVTSVVLCPGSRNIPLVQSMADDPDFNCYSITDERSAGFFALGLALKNNKPVAVCCTSGSALLNLHPAVSEAFYQQIPLLVLSADRPVAWLGQMDGQTVPQAQVFGSLVKHFVDLPEIKDATDAWYCNRLINEALLALNYQVAGPVHINIPISEPFFSFDTPQLPQAREISRYEPNSFNALLNSLQVQFNLPTTDPLSQEESLIAICRTLISHCPKIMLIIGQHSYGAHCLQRLSTTERLFLANHILLVDESLSNLDINNTCRNIDRTLALSQVQTDTELYPQLVITLGGHIISKRLKHYLREHKPQMHWHIAPDGAITDLYHCLSHVLVCHPQDFMYALYQAVYSFENNKLLPESNATECKEQSFVSNLCSAHEISKPTTTLTKEQSSQQLANISKHSPKAQSINVAHPPLTPLKIKHHFKNLSFANKWRFYSQQVFAPDFAYSQMQAIGLVVENLPANSSLHLANSSTVRYAQLFKMPIYPEPHSIHVLSNRGVNGIEGSLSTAMGYAAANPNRLNFILIGDLSFFYDMNALWHSHISCNVRILLLNNSGGEIFHALPNLHLTEAGQRFVTATHQTSAKSWVESQGFTYLCAHDSKELQNALISFMTPLEDSSELKRDEAQQKQGDKQQKQGSKHQHKFDVKPMFLEVFTDQHQDTQILKAYMSELQSLI